VQAKIREAERQNRKPPKPLDLERGKRFVPDLRELLNQEVSIAAEAIRSLTGPIRIRQEEVPGKRGARWTAAFSADVVALLRQVAREKGHPDARSLTAAPANPQPVEVMIDRVPKYERLAPVFRQMRDNGASIRSIAAAHGMSWQYASEIVRYAETGKRPEWKAGRRTGTGRKPAKYVEISEEVARLRDKSMSFVQIAEELGVSRATVSRAYDHCHQRAVHDAVARGETPCRGQYSRLGEDVYEKIRNLLRAGIKPSEIAARVGCGTSTVYRERRKMRAEPGEGRAA
jgi:transposase-like protein